MSAPDSGPPPLRRRRWLVPLLVASVAVNLVIVGAAVSGQVWPDHDGGKSSHRSADLMPRSFFRALDDERREELVEVFRARKTEWREERGALSDAAAALADALEREPFKAPQAQSAIADHAARSHQLVDLGAAVAADLIEALTPEERRDLAQAIRQRIEEDRQRRARRER
ncbi:MAG TPA: periplasmic heavy metal sensor [Aestuariivirgaceae bacterium]|nr:periplasmic heavy metal sensor [Aestuariivirgaceae bacterium]